jgi:hypothetical protein
MYLEVRRLMKEAQIRIRVFVFDLSTVLVLIRQFSTALAKLLILAIRTPPSVAVHGNTTIRPVEICPKLWKSVQNCGNLSGCLWKTCARVAVIPC